MVIQLPQPTDDVVFHGGKLRLAKTELRVVFADSFKIHED